MDPEARLAEFVDRFAPAMQERIRGCRAELRALLPDAVEMVWDNYNFLVLGFGPTHRPSDSVVSLAAQRRGVSLCFLQHAAELPDPTSILRGSGTTVRNVALDSVDDLARDDVRTLLDVALERAVVPMSDAEGPDLVIRSVSATQRPRR
jgi:hypothetical protein